MIQTIDGITYKIKEPFDMSFLSKYGQVFKVYDDQDSGNICFGVKKDGQKYFVKFAGAPTSEYTGNSEAAIERLRSTIKIYEDLRHENLINYLYSEKIGNGFAAVFEWVDAVCMGKQYPDQRRKFETISDEIRLDIFDSILELHRNVIKKGYVAIDFYDGSIMFDFVAAKTYICDIDFYRKNPVINNMGRMWGSSRFMSPEEFILGEPIDEISNVYLMGAVAFALFGGETDRSSDKWRLSCELYEVAKRAVSDKREDRYRTIKELSDDWNTFRYSF